MRRRPIRDARDIEVALAEHQVETLQRRLDAQLQTRIDLMEQLEREKDRAWDERMRAERVMARYRRFVWRWSRPPP